MTTPRRQRVVVGGVTRWQIPEPDPAVAAAELAAVEDRRRARAAAARIRAIDQLIAHPDVWARIAEHAEAAAVEHADPWARDVFGVLSGAACVLAAGHDVSRPISRPAPVDNGGGGSSESDRAATVRSSTTAPALVTPRPSTPPNRVSGRGQA